MKSWIRNSARAGALATGFLLFAASPAQAGGQDATYYEDNDVSFSIANITTCNVLPVNVLVGQDNDCNKTVVVDDSDKNVKHTDTRIKTSKKTKIKATKIKKDFTDSKYHREAAYRAEGDNGKKDNGKHYDKDNGTVYYQDNDVDFNLGNITTCNIVQLNVLVGQDNDCNKTLVVDDSDTNVKHRDTRVKHNKDTRVKYTKKTRAEMGKKDYDNDNGTVYYQDNDVDFDLFNVTTCNIGQINILTGQDNDCNKTVVIDDSDTNVKHRDTRVKHNKDTRVKITKKTHKEEAAGNNLTSLLSQPRLGDSLTATATPTVPDTSPATGAVAGAAQDAGRNLALNGNSMGELVPTSTTSSLPGLPILGS